MSQESQFDNLPPELITYIFDLLPINESNEKKECRLVCHRFRSIYDCCAKNVCFRITVDSNSINAFMKSYREFDTVQMKDMMKPMPSVTASRNTFPVIRNIKFGSGNSGTNVGNFLKYGCGNSQSIFILSTAFKNLSVSQVQQIVPSMNLDKLSKFGIQVSILTNEDVEKNEKHLDACIAFIKLVKIPNLKNFEFDMSHFANVRDIKATQLCSEYIEFIVRHSNEIKFLTCKINTKWGFNLPNISTENSNILCSNLKLKEFVCSLTENRYLIKWGIPLLVGSDKIQSLSFDFGMGIKLSQKIEEIFQKNNFTLENLKIKMLSSLNMNILGQCIRLKYLCLQVRNLENVNQGTTINLTELSTFHLILLPSYKHPPFFRITFDEQFAEWVTRSMPNLMKFTIDSHIEL